MQLIHTGRMGTLGHCSKDDASVHGMLLPPELVNTPANTVCLLTCFMTADEITKAEKRRDTTCLQPDVPDGLYDILIEVAHLLSFYRGDRLKLL